MSSISGGLEGSKIFHSGWTSLELQRLLEAERRKHASSPWYLHSPELQQCRENRQLLVPWVGSIGRGQNSGIKIEVNLEGNCLWVCLHFFTH